MALVPIVEGQSEVESVPILLRKVLYSRGTYDVIVARPFRVKRNQVVQDGRLEAAVWQALSDRSDPEALVVILDADDDEPEVLRRELLGRAEAVTDLPVVVSLATCEFEGWLLGAKESLRGVRGIREDAIAPEAPEAIRGAKERLSSNMTGGYRYVEVDDQPALTDAMDMDLAAARCLSFQRFRQDLDAVLAAIRPVARR